MDHTQEIKITIEPITGGWKIIAVSSASVSREAYCKDLKTVPQRIKELCVQLILGEV